MGRYQVLPLRVRGNLGKEMVLCISKSSSITGASPLDCLVSYSGHSLVVGSYLSAEMQSVYSTAQANRAVNEKRKESKYKTFCF